MISYAPIALFVYNRLAHVKSITEAIKKNSISKKSKIYIFSDFSNNKIEQNKVKKIRKYLSNLKGFKKIEIIKRKYNYGTSKNIVSGLNQIFKTYSKCIIIEDDILISKNFLSTMNYFLKKYENSKKIASVEGFMYPVRFRKNTPKFFFIRGSGCWGWATWRNSWNSYEDSAKKLVKKFKKNKKLIHEFNYYGSYPYYEMLEKQLTYNNSWAIKWAAGNFLKNKYTIYFKNSLVKNIGLDGSGINCKIDYNLNQKKFKIENIKVKNNKIIKYNLHAKYDISNYLRSKFTLFNKIKLILQKLL